MNNCLSGRCKETVGSLISLFSSPLKNSSWRIRTSIQSNLLIKLRTLSTVQAKLHLKAEQKMRMLTIAIKKILIAPKTVPLRDISELRMIQGFKDDDVFNIFSPYMTVHPVPAASGNKPVLVNINTAKPELIASLVPSAVGDQCREKFIKKMAQLRKKKSPFATDAKSLKNVFKDSLCYSAETGAEKNSREKWFTTHSKAFQFTIQGNTHKMQTRLKVVIERAGSGKKRIIPGQDSSGRSYRILSWRS